ncbi:MAG: glycosyl transferase, partial [SAR116 cluster bacterium]|nr:glycosyl transferase [SAR116 cluster bacterium]
VKNSIEGFGISYIEAAKFGVPSISGVDGGVVDAVINNKTGWNTNPLNIKQLESTLITAINNHKKREQYGYNAKKYFYNNFTGNKAFEKFLKIIMS